MYPIDFSEGRRKKQAKAFTLPKFPAFGWAFIAVPSLLIGLGVLSMDYVAVSNADTIIAKIEEAAARDETRQQKQIRELAGVAPSKKARNGELYETYTFSRVLPFSRPTATVIYSSSGRITKVLRDSEM